MLWRMALEVTGKLYKRFETQQVTERFNKRELVVELGGRHPQLVLFQLTGKRCADLDAFREGDPVRIEFSLRGREWTSRQGEVKYFNSLEVLKLEAAPGEQGDTAAAPQEPDDPGDVPF
jgi:hypothetical protein